MKQHAGNIPERLRSGRHQNALSPESCAVEESGPTDMLEPFIGRPCVTGLTEMEGAGVTEIYQLGRITEINDLKHSLSSAAWKALVSRRFTNSAVSLRLTT